MLINSTNRVRAPLLTVIWLDMALKIVHSYVTDTMNKRLL